jgi:hypothetical protein
LVAAGKQASENKNGFKGLIWQLTFQIAT